MNRSRRAWLRGTRRSAQPIRPPWSRLDQLTDRCSRCHACVDACPQDVIRVGDGGFPEIEFRRSGCTFCAQCVDACSDAVFEERSDNYTIAGSAWSHLVTVGSECLTRRGVVCQSCQDACAEEAITFDWRQAVPQPHISESACVGCGFCIAACPANAIEINPRQRRAATDPSGTQPDGANNPS